jgi:hypothetical protein
VPFFEIQSQSIRLYITVAATANPRETAIVADPGDERAGDLVYSRQAATGRAIVSLKPGG